MGLLLRTIGKLPLDFGSGCDDCWKR